ncbi:MAG: TonB-dependent receptor domain-containing protein [Kangiellaceae bacterium]
MKLNSHIPFKLKLASCLFASFFAFNSSIVFSKESENKYTASFFQQYLPQNALQMVERIPGFKFDEGESNRGFGGNAGNVLIDGARPTSKSGGITSALIRIPAAQVDYIEILRGGVSAGETSGQSIIANVVRKKDVSSGTWATKVRRAPDGRNIPNIEAAINTDIGEWQTAFDIDIGGFPGYRTALIEKRQANGTLNTASNETFVHRNKWIFANGEGSLKISEGLLTLNARLGKDKGEFDTNREIYEARLPDQTSSDQHLNIQEDNEFKISEFGIDWVKTSDDWKLHLIGLNVINDEYYENEVEFEDFLAAEVSNSHFSQDSSKNESIFRATNGFTGKNNFKPEYGIEIAKNTLSSLTNNSGNLENVKVEELRSEVFASFTFQASDDLSLEGSLTSEFSQIKVSGESSNKQSFQFIKPRVTANYKINKNNQLAVSAERKVGQLNFRDFAASNDAADDNTFSGNPDLSPDTRDELSINYDWSFSERGSFKIKAFHQWRDDILEQIVLPSGGQGLGNAGDSKLWGVETDLNLPLDWLLKNGLIEISHIYTDSEFFDPVINANRTTNGYTHDRLTFKLRQDLVDAKMAWGVEYWGDFTNTNFRVNERVTFNGNDRFRAFIETSRFFDVKIQLEVTHLNTGEYTRSRFIHGGTRQEPLAETEIAYRLRKPEIKLTVSGSF